MARIIDIEGIGEVNAAKLKEAGITSVEALRKEGATPKGRKAIAAKAGVGEAQLLKWVNHADLFRIKGVAGQYAELLEAAGVDTVVELSKRKPENLHAALREVNEVRRLVRALPSEDTVTGWVAQAKQLPREIKY